MEAEPVRFLGRELDDRLDAAREALAAFVGADPDDLAFVANATGGVNAVLRSLTLSPGDELLTTDHAYGACRNTLDYVAGRSGAHGQRRGHPVPRRLPGRGRGRRPGEGDAAHAPGAPRPHHEPDRAHPAHRAARRGARVAAASRRWWTARTRPAWSPLDLRALGAAYYSANCHKWICAPKGSAFLWVRRDRQADVHPLTISHGATGVRPGRSRFRLEFDWTGTHDPTAWLTVPKAIDYMGGLVSGGWPALMARNRALALAARELLCAAAGTPPPCPDGMIGSLASMILPDSPTMETGWRMRDPIQGRLFDDWGIEVPIMRWPAPPKRLLRISAQLYNSPGQYVASRRSPSRGARGRARSLNQKAIKGDGPWTPM